MWILKSDAGICLVLLLSLCSCGLGQENAQKRVPNSLVECYTDANLLERDNRLPATLPTLLDLIRKVEADPEVQFSLKDLVVALLHRFRLDGIQKAQGVSASSSVIPFSTTGHQFAKHAMILSKLIPGNAFRFPNETLTDIERCSLHYLMSSTIETQARGDEAFRCTGLAQLRSLRLPRRAGRYGAKDKEPLEFAKQEEFGVDRGNSDMDSQCPVESGVMRTKWGSVAVGPLLAGIAAGMERQDVSLKNLIPATRSGGRADPAPDPNARVNTIFAATLAGDLAEAALFQSGFDDNIDVGSPGAWNSTSVPRWYFLTKKNHNEMTDAEIRGGLDGLILGKQVRDWSNSVQSLKLSQLLDMYYSQRGVFSEESKACKRRELFVDAAPAKLLEEQAKVFAFVLERDVILPISLQTEKIVKVSVQATDSLIRYIPSSLNDLSCAATAPNMGGDSMNTGMATETYIIVDTSSRYDEIVQALSLLVDGLEPREYGSNYMVMNAQDLSTIVNTTHYTVDFHSQFNITAYQKHPPGFNIQRILTELKPKLYKKLNYEHENNIAGGKSHVVTFLPSKTATLSEADLTFANEHMIMIREEVPDVRFLFFAEGQLSKFEPLVADPKDLLPLRDFSTGLVPAVNTVLDRIREIPRRVINYRCNSTWQQEVEFSNVQFDDFVEPSGINFYRLHPNYFFENAERKVHVQGHGYGTLMVCYSRNMENPLSNSTNTNEEGNDVVCNQITSDTIEIPLVNPCENSYYIHECAPLYISVSAPQMTSDGNYRCDAKECRTPDYLRVTISAENLGCYSGVSAVIASLSLIIALLFVQLL